MLWYYNLTICICMCLVHPQAEAKIPHTTINNYNNQKKFNKPNRNPSQRPNCIKFLQMETVPFIQFSSVWKWNPVLCPAFVHGYIEIETATLFSETPSTRPLEITYSIADRSSLFPSFGFLIIAFPHRASAIRKTQRNATYDQRGQNMNFPLRPN